MNPVLMIASTNTTGSQFIGSASPWQYLKKRARLTITPDIDISIPDSPVYAANVVMFLPIMIIVVVEAYT